MEALAFVIATPGECVLPTLESMQRYAPELEYMRLGAVTPAEVDPDIGWRYPDFGTAIIAGLRCHAYSGNPMKRRAVFLSHLAAWVVCARHGSPVCVLESDAIFIRPFSLSEVPQGSNDFGMISLNDPRGATRKAGAYHTALQASGQAITEVPWIDDKTVPQGLPGHSAYLLDNGFAEELIEAVARRGAMPNDALVNRQWFPGKLGCLTRYATKVSGRPSTLA